MVTSRRDRQSPRPQFIEPLEPRRLLIAPTPIPGNSGVFTDIDGDQVTVTLTGPGTLSRIFVPGDANFALFTTSTDQTSVLSISVKKVGAGNGSTFVRGVSSGELKSFLAPTTDFGDSGLAFTGHVSTIVGGSVGSGDLIIGGAAGLPVSITMTEGFFGGGFSQPEQHVIKAPGKIITSLTSKIISAQIQAAVIRSVKFLNNPTNNVAILNTVFELTGAPGEPLTLGGMDTKGKQVLNMSMQVEGAVGPFKFGRTENVEAGITGAFKSLSILGPATGITMSCRSYGAVGVTGKLDSVHLVATASDAGAVGFGAVKLGPANNVDVLAAQSRVTSFSASSAIDTAISARSIGQVLIPGSAVFGVRGDAELNIATTDSSLPLAIGKITVKGLIGGSVVVQDGNCGPITVGGIAEGWVALIGTSSTDVVGTRTNGMPFVDAGLFTGTGGTLAALNVARPPLNGSFDVNNPNINRYIVMARAVTKIAMFTGFAVDSNGLGNHYGVATRSVGAYKRTGLNSSAAASGLTSVTLEPKLGSPGFNGAVFGASVETTLADPAVNFGFALLCLYV